ncbi:MAG: helix-turn-helix transcriptional regulator [Ruminococcus sp.]|nr:helix-turn-helix transcriptional regulator [Ruminococcus sp.]
MDYTQFEKLCECNGTTPTALSKKLGISKGNTTNWKNGGNPSVEILCKIADELNCTTDTLLGRKNTATNVNNFVANNITYGKNSGAYVINENHINETNIEILEILEDLSLKERSELIVMIFQFYEEHKK